MLPRRPTIVSAQLLALTLAGSALVGSLTPPATTDVAATTPLPVESPTETPVDVESPVLEV